MKIRGGPPSAGFVAITALVVGCSGSAQPVLSPPGSEVVSETRLPDVAPPEGGAGSEPTESVAEPSVSPSQARYAFPIAVASAADFAREHHDYPATDIFAPCDLEVLAPAAGVIHEVSEVDRWDPAVDDPATRGGLSIAIAGDDQVRYYMSHLGSLVAGFSVGDRLSAGDLVGTVGRTGNARNTPCHVHFGLSPVEGPGDPLVRRGVIWPWPYLDAWRAGIDTKSPRGEIERWLREERE